MTSDSSRAPMRGKRTVRENPAGIFVIQRTVLQVDDQIPLKSCAGMAPARDSMRLRLVGSSRRKMGPIPPIVSLR